MAGRIAAWSFSRLVKYQECPRRLKYNVIDKLKEPGSAAMDRGALLHKQAEDYLRSGGRIPKELKLIAPILKDFRKRGAVPEAEFCFSKDWAPIKWFDSKAWLRVKADVTIPPFLDINPPTVEIYDFKSGKLREEKNAEYFLQLELYSVAGLLTNPAAEQVKTSLVFIDHGKTVDGPVVERKELKKIQKRWEMSTKKMMSDTVFKPKPGHACRFCPFAKAKGGPCEF